MDAERWKKAAYLSDLKKGKPYQVNIGGENIMLVRHNDEIFAWSNQCPHYGAPLNKGYIDHHHVTCPWHNARFELQSGRMVTPPALDDLPGYEVKVENQAIYIGRKNEADMPQVKELTDSRSFLIIGGGAAGNTAAETLRREGFGGKITIVTADYDRPYDRPTLSKSFLAGKAGPDALPLRPEDFYVRMKIDLITGRRVTKLYTDEKIASTDNGDTYRYDKCLLATGGMPNMLDIPGADKKNIFTLRSFEDARKIDRAVEDAHHVLLVGAGFIGLESASSLRERGLSVTIVAPEETLMKKLLGQDVGKAIQKFHEKNHVTFHLGQTVSEFKGSDGVRQAVLTDDKKVDADIVIMGVGIKPAVDYLDNTDLVQDGAVPVNSRLQTNDESVFAAGDIAVVPNPHDNSAQRVEHWVAAESQGRFAAKSMLGEKGDYEQIPFFWTRQFGQAFKYIGYSRDFDNIVYRGNVKGEIFLAGYFKGEKFTAAFTRGMADELWALEQILSRGKKITPAQLQDIELDLSTLL